MDFILPPIISTSGKRKVRKDKSLNQRGKHFKKNSVDKWKGSVSYEDALIQVDNTFLDGEYWVAPVKRPKSWSLFFESTQIEILEEHIATLELENSKQERTIESLNDTISLLLGTINEQRGTLKSTLQDLSKAERSLSLRNNKLTINEVKRLHPEGSPQTGRGLQQDYLLDAATILFTGITFKKYECLMKMTGRTCIPSSNYFRYLPILEYTLKKMYNQSVGNLVSFIQEKYDAGALGELVATFDASWKKRYGYNSRYLFLAKCIILYLLWLSCYYTCI